MTKSCSLTGLRCQRAEFRTRKAVQSEEQKDKRLKKDEQNLRDLWNNRLCPKIHIIGILEIDLKK